MITEDYVSFETAKLLKEKGFDETCRAFWKEWNDEIHLCDCSSAHVFEFCHNSMLENYNDEEEINTAVPTLQMAMKWLREVHSLFIFISTWLMHEDGIVQYYYEIRNLNDEDFKTIRSCTITEFDSYEKTCEAAIKYCLENLI